MHKRVQKGDIQKIILTTIGIAGFIAIAAIAPNVLQVVDKVFKDKKRHRAYYIQSVLTKLKNRGLIIFADNNGRSVIRLTTLGERELLRYRLREKTIENPIWDGRWRMIVFDIQEYKRNIRDKIRIELTQFGFRRLQQSVWVYPHNCEEMIALLKADYRVGKELLYVTAEKIENDRWLREEFKVREV